MALKRPPTPRWVKISAIAGGVFVIFVLIMLALGHGPGRHLGHLPAPSASSLSQ